MTLLQIHGSIPPNKDGQTVHTLLSGIVRAKTKSSWDPDRFLERLTESFDDPVPPRYEVPTELMDDPDFHYSIQRILARWQLRGLTLIDYSEVPYKLHSSSGLGYTGTKEVNFGFG